MKLPKLYVHNAETGEYLDKKGGIVTDKSKAHPFDTWRKARNAISRKPELDANPEWLIHHA